MFRRWQPAITMVCLTAYFFGNIAVSLAVGAYLKTEHDPGSNPSHTSVCLESHKHSRVLECPCCKSSGHEEGESEKDCEFTSQHGVEEVPPPVKDQCPCCPGKPSEPNCPCPGGCALCSVAKIPIGASTISGPPFMEQSEKICIAPPNVFVPILAGQLFRPPKP